MSEELLFFKSQFFKGQKIHLNNAGLAPISRPALERIEYWALRFFEDGFYSDADYMAEVSRARASLAQIISCGSDDISFFQSTAGAISQIAFQFGLRAKDEVILWEQEYSSNLYPWQIACKRAGANLVVVASLPDLSTPIEALLKHVTENTRIIAVSWVQFQTGSVSNIKELVNQAHQKNIFVVVDVMQGLGLYEFDFVGWNVDAAVGGSHKWLVSPVGVGFLALAKQHRLMMGPHSVGSGTFGTCDDPASLECLPKTDGSKFEPGSKQVLEIAALGGSLDLILKTGVKTIGNEALRLAKRLKSGLTDLGFLIHTPYEVGKEKTNIVNFSSLTKNIVEITDILKMYPINYAVRGPGVRLSPHAFNSDEDIDKVIELLGES